jgi:hypothetical protein
VDDEHRLRCGWSTALPRPNATESRSCERVRRGARSRSSLRPAFAVHRRLRPAVGKATANLLTRASAARRWHPIAGGGHGGGRGGGGTSNDASDGGPAQDPQPRMGDQLNADRHAAPQTSSGRIAAPNPRRLYRPWALTPAMNARGCHQVLQRLNPPDEVGDRHLPRSSSAFPKGR